MRRRMMMNFLLFGFGLLLVTGCSSITPKNQSSGGYDNPTKEKEFAAIILSDLNNDEENAAYTAGVSNALDSEKVIPDIPEELRQVLSEPDVWVDHIDNVEKFLGKQFDFNAIVILQPTHTTETASILGIIPREQPVIKTEGMVYDLDAAEVIGKVTAYAPFNKNAKRTSISNAAEDATSELIHKKDEKEN